MHSTDIPSGTISDDTKEYAKEVKLGRLTQQIKETHNQVEHYGFMAVLAARDCGRFLSELKELLGPEEWNYYEKNQMPFKEATRKNYNRIHKNWAIIDSLFPENRPKSIREALRIISKKLKETGSDKGQGDGNKPVKKPVKAIIHTKAKEEITSILENSSLKNKGKLKAIKKFLESKELHYSLKLDEEEAASSDSRKAQPPAEVNDGEAASSDSHSAQPSAEVNGGEAASSDSHSAQPPAEVNGAIGASSDSHSAQPPAEVNGGEAASGDSRKAPTTC